MVPTRSRPSPSGQPRPRAQRPGRLLTGRSRGRPQIDDDCTHDTSNHLRRRSRRGHGGAPRAPSRTGARSSTRTGLPPLRRRDGGFIGLAAIIVSQQLSVASARAVQLRVESVLTPLTPERVLAATDEEMRLSGLSRPKQRTLRAVAAAIVEQRLDLRQPGAGDAGAGSRAHDRDLGHRPLDGRCLSAVLPRPSRRLRRRRPGDPGGRPRTPSGWRRGRKPAELEALAEAWRPWRGVAARLLWAYYAALKQREGINA